MYTGSTQGVKAQLDGSSAGRLLFAVRGTSALAKLKAAASTLNGACGFLFAWTESMRETPLTVRELIAALEALPETQKDLPVHCLAEAGCVSTPVLGIHEVTPEHVMLDGE
jgi:hypothetical protein